MKTPKYLHFLSILLPLLAAGCTVSTTEEMGGTLTLVAECPQTRTANCGMRTEWLDTDELSVFAEGAGGFMNYRFGFIGNYSFRGYIKKLQEVSELYVVYPYTSHWKSPESLTIDVPSSAVQDGNDDMGHLAGPSFPLYGICHLSEGMINASIDMNQLLSVARFNITNGDDTPITVKRIDFTTPVPVTGRFTVDVTGGDAACVPVQGSTSNTITLTVDDGETIGSGETASFYVGCMPFDATGNFDITVVADSNGDEVASSKNVTDREIEFTAGAITVLNYTFMPSAPAEEYIGKFNLVNADMDAYMAEAEKQYTDDNWLGLDAKGRNAYGLTIIKDYNLGDNGDLGEEANPDLVPYSYDRPLPVVIPVEGHNGQSVTVTVTGDGIYAEETYSLTTTVQDAKVEFFNLIPNRRYHYTVTCSGSAVSRGCFDTEGRRRILQVSDVVSADKANNFRDFGGLKTLDGRRIAYGKVFRGTNMDGLSDAEKAYMTDVLNIGLDIDLRLAGVTGRNQAKRILDASKVAYSNVGFGSVDDLKAPDKIRPTLLAILEAIKSGKAVYIHCFAGADRTGCLSMLIEALCGVSEKDCTIDYELTSFSCIGARPRTAYNVGILGYFHPHLNSRSGSTFQDKAVQFLKECELTDEQIAALQKALVEDAE